MLRFGTISSTVPWLHQKCSFVDSHFVNYHFVNIKKRELAK